MKFWFIGIIFNALILCGVQSEPKPHSKKPVEMVEGIPTIKEGKVFPRGTHHGGRYRNVLTLNEIYRRLLFTSEKDAVTLFEIGRSCNEIPIYAVKIHQGKGNASAVVTMVVEFGIHAREWVSPASALYLIKRLLQERGTLIEGVRWYLIPVLNPDGYNYSTHEETRRTLWRKNRRILEKDEDYDEDEDCDGVDLNRNFGVAWAAERSEETCSQTYPGTKPFSEPESVAARNLVKSIGPKNVDVYVAVHSCAQSILYPYGYQNKAPPPEKLQLLKKAAKKMADEMYKVRNQTYSVKQAAALSGISGGGSDDFMFEHFHIPLVYTLELGDYHSKPPFDRCFHPKPSVSDAIQKECFAGLTALAKYALAYKTSK